MEFPTASHRTGVEREYPADNDRLNLDKEK